MPIDRRYLLSNYVQGRQRATFTLLVQRHDHEGVLGYLRVL